MLYLYTKFHRNQIGGPIPYGYCTSSLIMPSRYLSEEEKIKIVAIFLEKKVYRNTEMTPSYTLVVASYLKRSVYQFDFEIIQKY